MASGQRVFRHRSVMRSTIAELTRFHSAPDALRMLTPPPIFLQVLRDDRTALTAGDITFRLWFGPLPVRWVARHDPAAYDPPRQFADELASLPLSAVVPWRHVHEFAEAGLNSTRVTDRVFTQFRARCCGRCSATGTGSSLVTWPHTNGLARFATGP